jgi:hypothetical protein
MKKILSILGSLMALAALAQPAAAQNTTPACQISGTFTATGRQGGPTPSTAANGYNNKTSGCTNWWLVLTNTGFSAVSVAIQDAADSSGVAGSWANWQGTVVTGSNPATSTTFTLINVTGFYPWVAVNAGTLTGSGTVTWSLYGYKGGQVASAGGVTGSGTTGLCAQWASSTSLTAAADPCGSGTPTLTSTYVGYGSVGNVLTGDANLTKSATLGGLSVISNTNVTGSEIITNGSFAMSCASWTLDAGATCGSGNVALLADGMNNPQIHQPIATVSGTTYEIAITISDILLNTPIGISSNNLPGEYWIYAPGTSKISFTSTFTGTDEIYIYLAGQRFSGEGFTVSSVSMKAATIPSGPILVTDWTGANFLSGTANGTLILGQNSTATTDPQNISESTFFGANVGGNGISTQRDTVFGANNLMLAGSSARNTVIGDLAARSITDAGGNVIAGYGAAYSLATGGYNVIISTRPQDQLDTNVLVSGDKNILIGYLMDTATASSSNTLKIGSILSGTGINADGGTLQVNGTLNVRKIDNTWQDIHAANFVMESSSISTDTTTGHTGCFSSVYDVNGTAYKCFGLGTNGDTPDFKVQVPTGSTYSMIIHDDDNNTDRTFLTATPGNTPTLALATPSGGTFTVDATSFKVGGATGVSGGVTGVITVTNGLVTCVGAMCP